MSIILNKARKGDVVAIKVTRSSTRLNGPTDKYESFALAFVTKATRDGLATHVRLAGQSGNIEATKLDAIMTINDIDRQAQARRLAESTEYPGKSYSTQIELRDAILLWLD